MADLKISQLTAITTLTPATDVLPVVDVTGTTKKITTNQILGSGGTATLASATITGDLTARNWYVTGGSLPGVGNGNPFAYRIGGGGLGIGAATETGTTAPIVFYAGQGGVEQYRIAPLGVFTWSDGAGGTRMTLNSTGLGVGGSPAGKITAVSNGSMFEGKQFSSGSASYYVCDTTVDASGKRWRFGFTGMSGSTVADFSIYNQTDNLPIADFKANGNVLFPTGNVGIGVAAVTGGKLTVAGPIVRNKGSNTLTQNVATTVATLPGEGLFIAYAYTNASNPSAFTSYAVILCDSVGSRIIANNGTQITITTSTFALQVTQAFAATLNVVWSFVQIG